MALGFTCAAAALTGAAQDTEPVALPELVVSVARAPQDAATLPIAVRVVPADRLATADTVDAALRDDPAFSLFRRNSSLSANPTAQGVSLRGVGPSGASRTAVMLDDLPLNDPFGGWVAWSQVPSLSLARAEIAHGGGSGTWGSAALGGTVVLSTAPLEGTRGSALLEIGSDESRRAEVTHTARAGGDALRVDARILDYGGFHPLRPRDRGAVDRPLEQRHRLGQLTWLHRLTDETEAIIAVRGFDEDRVNGTRLQQNATRLLHASATLQGRLSGETRWKTAAWAQWQDYSSFFTAVSADRMQETPANDQYSVPSRAAGIHASRIFGDDEGRTVLGLDGRWVEGETRERYLFRDGAFAQRRIAGGTQHAAGVFVHHGRPLSRAVHLSGALRLDHWAARDGRTRESSLATGANSRDDRHPDDSGLSLSPRLGVSIHTARDTTLRAAVYHAFRQPTLNEYYRPFRVGSTTTLANPSLDIETLEGVDLSVEHRVGDLQLSAGVFWNLMHDGVGNVTLSSSPGGTTRQRQNLGRTEIRGVELAARWMPHEAFSLRAGWLAVDAEVTRAPAQPGLVGRSLAQVPEYVLTVAASWRIVPRTRITAELRAVGRQFEDDENALPLAASLGTGLRVDHRLSDTASLFVDVHDLLDDPAQTSRTAAGLITYDQPRSVRGGVRLNW